jgi:hypothetical protein
MKANIEERMPERALRVVLGAGYSFVMYARK